MLTFLSIGRGAVASFSGIGAELQWLDENADGGGGSNCVTLGRVAGLGACCCRCLR